MSLIFDRINKTQSALETFLKISGFVYLIMTIVGFVQLKIYFSNFNVNINDYITVSELFFSSFDKLFWVVLALIIQYFLWLPQIKNTLQLGGISENDKQLAYDKYLHDVLSNFVKSTPLLFFYIFTSMSIGLITIFKNNFSSISTYFLVKDFSPNVYSVKV